MGCYILFSDGSDKKNNQLLDQLLDPVALKDGFVATVSIVLL